MFLINGDLPYITVIGTSHHQKLGEEDNKIETHNKKLKTAQEGLEKKQRALLLKQQQVNTLFCGDTGNSAYTKALQEQEKAAKSVEKAEATYEKLVEARSSLPSGSGKVSIL